MRRIKFLHCADIHLDAPFSSLGSSEGKAAARRQDLKDVVERIVKTAEAYKADLIIVSGDLYEHDYVRKSTINYVNNLFMQIPCIDVFLLPGNHDPFITNSYYNSFKWSPNVHILSQDNVPVHLEAMGVWVYGIGFDDFSGGRPEISNIKPVDSDCINILLAHGTVDMNIGRECYNPMESNELAALGMDYVALGHFHNRLDDAGGMGIIYNPGCPEPMGFDEAGEHGVFLGTIEKENRLVKKLELEFIKTNKKLYTNIDVKVDGCHTNEQVIARINQSIPACGLDNTLFSVALKGYASLGLTMDIPKIQQYFSDRVFFIKVKDETVPDYDFETIAKEPGLKGLFVRKLLAELNNTSDESKRRLLMKSLYYGLEALDRGEVNAG
jgi:DNA repair exonuclease SbcCD nuclease subunit